MLRFLRENERLVAVAVATVLVMAGQGVISPILPLFARDFGVGTAAIGTTLSAFALARLVLNMPLGALADRRGRRPLIIGGPILTAIGMVGSGLATSLPILLVWRVVAGAGSAAYMSGAQIYLADISTPQNRARFLGFNQTALLVGTSVGPAIGGLLADAFGYRVPFHVVGALALLAGIYGWLRIPETRPTDGITVAEGSPPAHGDPSASTAPPASPAVSEAEKPPTIRPISPTKSRALAMLRRPEFLAVALVNLAIFFTRAGARGTLMPLLAADRFDYSAAELGWLLTATSLLIMVLVGPAAWIADSFGRRIAIVPPGLALSLAVGMYALATQEWILIFASLLTAAASGLIGPAPAAYAADIAPPEARGVTLGLYRSFGDLGFVFGPVMLGLLADNVNRNAAFIFNGILMAAVVVYFWFTADPSARTGTRQPATRRT